MPTTSGARPSLAPEEEFDLDMMAQHNDSVAVGRSSGYHKDTKGLTIYDGYHQRQDDLPHSRNPLTPRSNTASEGIRTRSGRSTRRTDSPISTSKSRASKSPAPRLKRDRKSRVDKSRTPKLTGPLSVLTKDMVVPLKDMDSWVNRSAEVRREEAEKRNGYVTRPMNSFMLYRSAYAERTKQWCAQNNHQVVSSVSGESWPMEPAEVRDRFNEWAKTERANHQAAHPNYKFTPNKSASKRRKDDLTDEEDEASDLDVDPDGEYHVDKSVRVGQRAPPIRSAHLDNTVSFQSHPYFSHEPTAYNKMQYQYANQSDSPSSNDLFYDASVPYGFQPGQYIPQVMHQYPHNAYFQDNVVARVPTPQSLNDSQQSIGGYGLPGCQQQMTAENFFADSSGYTPVQPYSHFGEPMYTQYINTYPQHYESDQSFIPQSQQLYEHQSYLQMAPQPQTVVDPSLDDFAIDLQEAASEDCNQYHFDDAIGDLTPDDIAGFSGYYHELTSSQATLAPSWSPIGESK